MQINEDIIEEMQRLLFFAPPRKVKSCIFFLPGRSQYGSHLLEYWCHYSGIRFSDVLLATFTPRNLEWYPLPRNAEDQDDSVVGIKKSIGLIESLITSVEENFNLPRRKIGIVGYSAGGVMANYVGTNSNKEFAGVVCHSGAYLEPEKMQKCKFGKMPFVLSHSLNDSVFDWYERYLPMKEAFKTNKYDVSHIEDRNHNHAISKYAIMESAYILEERLQS